MKYSILLFLLFTLGSSLCFSQSGRGASFIQWVHKEPRERDLLDYYLHHTFFPKAAGQQVGYCIYLPPNYEADSNKRYPVIYNPHGNSGTLWDRGQECTVLHQAILAGKWPPMIMVFPNGGNTTFHKDS